MAQEQYSGLDRFLHKMVLGSKMIQSTSFELQRLLAPKLPKPDRPVFIVGMARSGTTTLLNLLMETGEFESSRYRDLPLPLFPAFWRKVHKGLSLGNPPVQRAHDDGILVSPDSPEAFEDVFWSHIGNRLPENQAAEAFSHHISATVAEKHYHKRYVSKNNNNICRLKLLQQICQKYGGTIVIPIRDPLKTAESSLRMHRRFIKLQEEDPFVLEYMNLIGHHEFGKGLRWLEVGGKPFSSNYEPDKLECWLEYWIYIHKEIESAEPNHLTFVDFDLLRSGDLKSRNIITKRCQIQKDHNVFFKHIKPGANSCNSHHDFQSKLLCNTAELIKRNVFKNTELAHIGSNV